MRLRRSAIRLAAGLAIAALVLGLRGLGALRPVEAALHDRLVAATAGDAPSPRLVLVLVAEDDVARFGWPLSDALLAQAITRLQQAGARAIGIDLYRDVPVGEGADALREAIAAAPSLLWVHRLAEPGQPGVAPPAALAGSTRAVLADLVLDPDGVARRGLLLAEDATQRNQPTLGAAIAQALAAARFRAADAETLAIGQGRIALLSPARAGLHQGVDLAGYQMLLDFQGGAGAFAAIGFGALIDGRFEPALVAGRGALLGSAAVSVRDRFVTPVAPAHTEAGLLPGVGVHAHVADQLLRIAAGEAALAPLPRAVDAALVLAAGLLGAAAALLPALAAAGALLLLLTLAAAAVLAAFAAGIALPAAPFVLALLLAGAAATWLQHLAGAADRRRLRAAFAHYLDPRLIEAMVSAGRAPDSRASGARSASSSPT
jgi:CHASE2 domain-containing sensor protein